MGCAVNGPGEAREADIGLAFGRGEATLFRKGKPSRRLRGAGLLDAFLDEVDKAAAEAGKDVSEDPS